MKIWHLDGAADGSKDARITLAGLDAALVPFDRRCGGSRHGDSWREEPIRFNGGSSLASAMLAI